MASRLRRITARTVVVSAAASCLALAAPAARANEMTIGGGGDCDVSATVWWHVPPEPGKRPVGATVSWGCLTVNLPNLEEYLPSTTPLPPPPITIVLPLEP